MVTKEMWVDWKNHPVTQQYLRAIAHWRMGKLEAVAEGQVSGEQLLMEIGRTQGLKDAIEHALTSFNFVEIDSDTESSGVSNHSEG